MSTRAVYTFKDEYNNIHHVYKHHDGYPSGAIEFILKALDKSWQLPRFESGDFAAAFVAANKDGGGGVYLTKGPKDHGDLSYKYETTVKENKLYTKVFEKTYPSRGYQLIEEGYTGQLWNKYLNSKA
jgi:hypothetical protein